jgi:Tol biopolymer transport system component
MIGQTLAHYRITAALGAGGMGEVYRATDTKLGRDVAIKVLPSEFAQDPERLARLQREATLLAALNHPHIAAIHGLEESDGNPFLVLELVEGEDLAERLKRGPIPIGEALEIARQIAEALEEAHEKGIVHRDLKPANVKVTPDGKVKVLDFGLAKAWAGDPISGSSSDLSQSPTLAHSGTQAGVILGTAAYMSPEQARGKAVDKRTDVWAFGVLLYEMLTGRRAFAGEDVSETLAFVLARDLELSELPVDTPASVRRLLRRCLARDRKARLADMSVARLEIDDAGAAPERSEPAPFAAPTFWQRPAGLALVALAAVAIGGAAVGSLVRPAPTTRALARFGITLPEGTQPTGLGRHALAVAPDGSSIAYTADQGLWLRPMAELQATRLAGFVAAREPFFSPDGRWIGFYSQGELKKVSVSGGAPITLCEAGNPLGASWGEDDTILFGQREQGIWRVPATGGAPETVIEVGPGEEAHGPQILPGGEWVLFTLQPATVDDWDDAQIVVQSLMTGAREILIAGGRDARYLPSGHLVYALNGVLLGVAFDADRRTIVGGPVALIEGVYALDVTGAVQFSPASNGLLVYRPGAVGRSEQRGLTRVDRSGTRELLPVSPGPYYGISLSPDGTRVALGMDGGENQDLWVAELDRGSVTRVTTDAAARVAIWSPDGQSLVFESVRDGVPTLYRKAADGTGPVELLFSLDGAERVTPRDWTPDGTALVVEVEPLESTYEADIGLVSLEGPGSWEPLIHSEADESHPSLSPDGGWIAYESSDSGQEEVYVQRFPDLGSRRLISIGGGYHPIWSSDGTELFYLRSVSSPGPPGMMMRVAVEREGTSLTAGRPEELFEWTFYTGPGGQRPIYDVGGDGRFLMVAREDQTGSPDSPYDIVVVQNWTEELKRLVPAEAQ